MNENLPSQRYSQIEPLNPSQVEDLFEQAVEDWVAYLEDDDIPENAPWDTHKAGWILEYEHGSEAAVLDLMEERLYAPNDRVRQVACKILWEAGTKADADTRSRIASSLGEAIKLEGDPTTLAKMLYGFGYFDASDLAPFLDTLIGLVDHHDDYVRDRLADTLSSASRQGEPRTIHALMRLADDDDDEVRWSAVYELSALMDSWDGHAEIAKFLEHIASTDSSDKIRETASEYLE